MQLGYSRAKLGRTAAMLRARNASFYMQQTHGTQVAEVFRELRDTNVQEARAWNRVMIARVRDWSVPMHA